MPLPLALVPRWVWVYLAIFLFGLVAGGLLVHSMHNAFSRGQKALAERVLEKLDSKVDEATSAVEEKHAQAKEDAKAKTRVIYREVVKRVPQNDPAGCAPLEPDVVGLLNAARTAKTAEEALRITKSLDDAAASAVADPAHR